MAPRTYNWYTKLSIAIIIIAILFRITLMSISTISGDACWHFSAAKFIANEGKFPLFEQVGRDEPFWPPPLFHIISAFFYSLFGEIGLKLVPLIFGSLSLVFSYLILRKFLNDRASFYAILFMSFIPIAIDYSILGYVDSILPFFFIISIYFALNNKFAFSGISAGLAILAKYNGIFVIPVLAYIAYKNSKKDQVWRNILLVSIIPAIISLPWFIRNWMLLGNPLWPFLNFIFNGYSEGPRGAYSSISLANLSSIYTYIRIYVGFFGVPNGSYWLFFSLNLPPTLIWALISLFIAGTLVFIFPLSFGFKKNKGCQIFYILLALFGILSILYELNARAHVSRQLLPGLLAVAFIYGVGMNNILEKYPKFGKILAVLIVSVVFGFAFSEVVKFKIATDSWNFYKEDFDWVKLNTNKDSVFLIGSQCLPFRLDRKAVLPSLSIDSDKYGYVWVNQDFNLEPQSILNKEHLNKIRSKKLELVYNNKKTKTEIYRLIKGNR